MTPLISRVVRRGRTLALAAAALVAGLGVPARRGDTTALRWSGADDRGAVTVTERDVAAANAKARMAYDDLVAMWTDAFARVGARCAPPGIARYRGAVRTACGVMGGDNAAYCAAENEIYFDEVFLAAQAKRAARQVGTDGDMAAIGVIAHEMGHAVAIQLGHVSRVPYENEAVADCLAGAFARRADAQGSLEPGDVDEAFYAMYTAGDPPPQLTGDRRIDRRIVARQAVMGHGSYEQRMGNFRAGLEGGAQACVEELRGVE